MGADEDPESLLCSRGERLPLAPDASKAKLADADGEARALDAVRLLGAVHIVLFHALPAPFALWGRLWVIFFFMCSGFGPAMSKLRRGDEPQLLPRWHTLVRRWVSIYPFYFIAFTWNVAISPHKWHKHCAGHAMDCRAELLMLQGFGATWWSALSAINVTDWYCAVLLVYWLFEEPFYALCVAAWRRGHVGRAAAAVVLAAWWYWLPRHAWYRSLHDLRWVEFLHFYAVGVFLAFCLHDRCLARLPGVGTLAGLLLVALFSLVRNPQDIKWWMYNRPEWVSPLFCMLILGLEHALDPFAVLLRARHCRLAREVSYGIYIFQLPCKNMLERTFAKIPSGSAWKLQEGTPAFVLALLAMVSLVALVASLFIQQPLDRAVRRLLR